MSVEKIVLISTSLGVLAGLLLILSVAPDEPSEKSHIRCTRWVSENIPGYDIQSTRLCIECVGQDCDSVLKIFIKDNGELNS